MNQVDQLQLRLPGMSATDAQILAREVAEQLVLQIPEMPRDIQLGEIKIQLTESHLNEPGSLAGVITHQVIRQIKEAIVFGK